MAIKNAALRSVKADHLWSVREDLHARFDALVEPQIVDEVLDSIASDRDAKVTMFSKIFIEKEAAAALQSLDFITLDHGPMAA